MNKIPLSVSSTLSNVATDNALMVTPYGNATGKTGTAAPVLIAVESEGTVDVEAFAAALPAKGGQGTAAQARLVVNALAELLGELVDEYGAITVMTPLGRIDTFVAGSLEYATDPVDPAVNVPFLGVVPGADVMKAFSQIETYVPTAACPASLKRIRDVATEAHAIRGTNPWYAQGYGMTTGGTGETVKLLNPLTRATVCTVAVDAATKSEAQFKCTLPNTSPIPVGKYLLQIMTLAGGETTLWPLELPVNLVEAITPAPRTVTVTGERSDKDDAPNELNAGYAANFDGTNLDTVESVTWKDESTAEGATGTVAAEHWSANAAGTVLTLDDTVAQTIKTAAGASAVLKFTFTSHGGVPGSAEQTVTLGGLVIGA